MFEPTGLLGLSTPRVGKKTYIPHRFPKKVKRKGFNVVELFAGAGGLALGFEHAGFRSEALVECDNDAAQTLRINNPKWNVVNEKVENIKWEEFSHVDVVTGGFPCQAFSYAGKSLGFEDPRGGLIFEMFRCIEELKPRVVLAENVRGLLTHNNGKTIKTIISGFEKCGYNTMTKLVDAQYYGVPQKRQRLIIIAKTKTDGKDWPLFPQAYNTTVPLSIALKDCPESEGVEYSQKKKAILSMVPEGGCWVDLPDKVQKDYMGSAYGTSSIKGGRRGMARRLSWSNPSLTILCSPSQKQTERCHPAETRPLTIRESARIQTFPDHWKFHGSIASQYRQIGNAVPVRLGYLLGNYVSQILEK